MCVCVCAFSIALTMVTIQQTSLVKTMKASSLTQYLLLTFNRIFPWSSDNVSTVRAGVALDPGRGRSDMKEEYEVVE